MEIPTRREQVPFDAAIFHAFSPRVPLTSAALVGIDAATLVKSSTRWDALAVELGTMREFANRHGVATDRLVYPKTGASRERFARMTKPFGMKSLAMVHFTVRERVGSAITLFSCKADAFLETHVTFLRTVAPTIALGDSLLVLETDTPRAPVPVALRCGDGRLTARQQRVVEHVALGHTNEQIARALELSPNTLRNHLVAIFRRLGASNRADVVRLAVLTPSQS